MWIGMNKPDTIYYNRLKKIVKFINGGELKMPKRWRKMK